MRIFNTVSYNKIGSNTIFQADILIITNACAMHPKSYYESDIFEWVAESNFEVISNFPFHSSSTIWIKSVDFPGYGYEVG